MPIQTPARVRRITATIREHPWLAAWVALLPFALLRSGMLAEADTFWQIRTGQLTMSNRAIPSSDPFSWTAAGEPWTQNSWGFNVVLGAAYNVGGLSLVALLCAAIVAGVAWLALMLTRGLGAHPLVAALLLSACWVSLFDFLSARPQLVDYAAVLLVVLLAGRVVTGVGTPFIELASIGGLFVAWVNLHAAAPIGVAILGLTATLAAVNRPTRNRAIWAYAATAVAACGTLLNPYGFDVFTQSLRVADASTTLITEWQPLDFGDPSQLAVFLPGVVALIVAARRRDVVYAAALVVTAVGSVGAIRVLPLLLLVAFPVLASAATRPSVTRYIASRRVMLTQGSVVLLVMLGVYVAPAAAHIGQPDPGRYSPDVVAAIPKGCDLFNSYDLGGYVILKRPDVRVSIDGRNDMYGVGRVAATRRALDKRPGPELDGAGCVLIPPASPLAGWLREEAGWTMAASDQTNALFVRKG
jgi:hypothetical protein